MIHGNTTLMEFMTEVLAATESYSHQVPFEGCPKNTYKGF